MSLTLAYMTTRHDPKIEWFFDSLWRHSKKIEDNEIELVIVDALKFERHNTNWNIPPFARVVHTNPKPCVWQGEHRLTKENWWAASNARTTALCHCRTSHLAYIDDLSVVSRTWLDFVLQACSQDRVFLGAYHKLKGMEVENGEVVASTGEVRDCRWHMGHDERTMPCDGEKLFGCSLVGPVEAFLKVNGWPEMCDGLSFEDVIMGKVMENAGVKFGYARKMLTRESEDHHHIEPCFKRSDYGVSPNDKSHKVLEMARSGITSFENHFNIRELRANCLAGKPFPIPTQPEREWYTGTLLKDL